MDVMPGEPRDRYAITIQRWTRGWLSRKRAARLAALSRQEKLQRRAQVLRERLQISEQERRYLEQLDPAACIEYWRKRDRASLDIQRYYRGWCVRKRADLMRARCQRSQAAVVIQKYARGHLARQGVRKRGSVPLAHVSREGSPHGCQDGLGFTVADGQMQIPEERKAKLLAMAQESIDQCEKIKDKTDATPEKVAALLEESVSVSRDVVRVLAGAAKVRESTDHLLRTWQARHDLPSDADVLDPNMFPRPPPGTRREERARMAHALSLAEVVDITDLHESEESWWNVYVHSVVDATLLEPHLERERHVALSKARKAQWEFSAKAEAHRLRCLHGSSDAAPSNGTAGATSTEA